MATRPIVPRANGEGSLGVNTTGAEKFWGDVFTDKLNGADAKVMAAFSDQIMRKPSTTYTAGQIAYHSALPTGYYLECTTQGVTSAGDITPMSTIGGTVTDGTVVWTVSRDLPLIGGGALTGTNLTWNDNDLGGSAIAAKSLGTNGYIKYASGLIIQWRPISIQDTTPGYVHHWGLPISFSNTNYAVSLFLSGASSITLHLQLANEVRGYTSDGVTRTGYLIAIGY
jgi:hypothetical protein